VVGDGRNGTGNGKKVVTISQKMKFDRRGMRGQFKLGGWCICYWP